MNITAQTLILTFMLVGCSDWRLQKSADLYDCLLQRSVALLQHEENASVMKTLHDYIDTTSEYNFLGGRQPYEIAPIILSDSSKQRIVCFAILRGLDGGLPVDMVKYISGSRLSGSWKFRLRNGYTRSFSYENGQPFLTEKEILVRVITDFSQENLVNHDLCTLNEDLFASDWYNEP
jgi:hypothetical protein